MYYLKIYMFQLKGLNLLNIQQISPQFIYFISLSTCGEFQICGEFYISYSTYTSDNISYILQLERLA